MFLPAVAAFLLTLAAAAPLCAQSGEANYPTPVFASELSGRIAPRDVGDARRTRHFYTLPRHGGRPRRQPRNDGTARRRGRVPGERLPAARQVHALRRRGASLEELLPAEGGDARPARRGARRRRRGGHVPHHLRRLVPARPARACEPDSAGGADALFDRAGAGTRAASPRPARASKSRGSSPRPQRRRPTPNPPPRRRPRRKGRRGAVQPPTGAAGTRAPRPQGRARRESADTAPTPTEAKPPEETADTPAPTPRSRADPSAPPRHTQHAARLRARERRGEDDGRASAQPTAAPQPHRPRRRSGSSSSPKTARRLSAT